MAPPSDTLRTEGASQQVDGDERGRPGATVEVLRETKRKITTKMVNVGLPSSWRRERSWQRVGLTILKSWIRSLDPHSPQLLALANQKHRETF